MISRNIQNLVISKENKEDAKNDTEICVWTNQFSESRRRSLATHLSTESDFTDDFKNAFDDRTQPSAALSALPFAPNPNILGLASNNPNLLSNPAETPQFTIKNSLDTHPRSSLSSTDFDYKMIEEVDKRNTPPSKRRIITSDPAKLWKALESLEMDLLRKIDILTKKNEIYEQKLSNYERSCKYSKECMQTLSFRIEEADIKINNLKQLKEADQVRLCIIENKLNDFEKLENFNRENFIRIEKTIDEIEKNKEENCKEQGYITEPLFTESIKKIEEAQKKLSNRINNSRGGIKEIESVLKNKYDKEMKILKNEIINLSHHNKLSMDSLQDEIASLKKYLSEKKNEDLEFIIQNLNNKEQEKTEPSSQNSQTPEIISVENSDEENSQKAPKIPSFSLSFRNRSGIASGISRSASVKDIVPPLDISRTERRHQETARPTYRAQSITERYQPEEEIKKVPEAVESIVINSILGRINNERTSEELRKRRLYATRSASPFVSLSASQSQVGFEWDGNSSEQLKETLMKKGLSFKNTWRL
ncbi:unnamed protein product [Blepharisma stoltei]|uniref:Uncharacterized protein n=1 Tax=Blepharisma stoltei TaxID=1481888 RepID=A0AAU9INS0_9CILI|nr:unnamed protein product [Blepharisma stoltei]